ncbi:MAG TPA: HlyD family efflux transporter periplasmic adaptor subunit [Trebonia sp.]|nr:HlyD family efflux transporter periplasmic adaptor subunit [Trebonia sp.]
MNAATEQSPTARPDTAMAPVRRRRRVASVIAAVVLVVAAGAALAVTNPFASGGATQPGVADEADPTSLQPVTRQDLSDQTQVSATLGYAGSYSVVNQAQGTVTSLPAAGQVVSQGQVLYQVSGEPVVLLYGDTPAYRALSEGADASDVTGADVAELNADLVALGYATTAEIPAGSDEFTWWTKDAVEKLQKALGVTQTGTLTLGQAVFVPGAARVTTISATLGAPAQAGQPVLTATSTTRQVSIALDADQQSEVAVGDKVTITLPDNQTTPGVVSAVGAVATAGQNGGSSTITVLVNPADPAATGTWDQAPVNVTITTGSVSNALVVPVDALLAQPNGTYAVEVAGANATRHLVPVTLGLFDDADGLVQVTGTSLTAGQQIVVPNL